MVFYPAFSWTWVLEARVMLSQIAESRLNFRHSKNVKLELNQGIWQLVIHFWETQYYALCSKNRLAK